MMSKIPPGVLNLKSVDHVGIHVRDINKVIDVWQKMYGIGPWAVREMKRTLPDGKVLTTKLAFAYSENGVEFELIQPPEGSQQWMDAHGEGLQHWGFFVDDVNGEAAKLVEKGAKIVAQVPGQWIYLDAPGAGGVIFELMRKRGRIVDP
jgi:4-hydroxyphenylpyruvate dioxygenase-like putative hemolysin